MRGSFSKVFVGLGVCMVACSLFLGVSQTQAGTCVGCGGTPVCSTLDPITTGCGTGACNGYFWLGCDGNCWCKPNDTTGLICMCDF